DRGLVGERERAELSDAYAFLRMLEHRLQMEHGLQTHSVPDEATRRALVARRMNFAGQDALADFNRALELHTARVRAAYERVFGEPHDEAAPDAHTPPHANAQTTTIDAETDETVTIVIDAATDAATVVFTTSDAIVNAATGDTLVESATGDALVEATTGDTNDAASPVHTHPRAAPFQEPRLEVISVAHADAAATLAAAQVFAPRLIPVSGLVNLNPRETQAAAANTNAAARIARLLHDAAHDSLNPRRALSYVARVAASLDKSSTNVELSEESLRALVRLCGASEFFGEMIAGNPALIPALVNAGGEASGERDYRALLRREIDRESSFRAELIALRRTWAQLLVETGARDARGELSHAESNRSQTELAAASINAAYFIARRELARRYGNLAAGPRLAVLALGRLASGGMDYGSDLDLVIIYDARVRSPVSALTKDEAYTRLVELMVSALSSLTRAGYVYRVDLRLRPDGKNGALVRSDASFVEYLRARTGVWEWLAYVKLRAVGGDLELGRAAEAAARRVIHEAARACDAEELRRETRRVRERLEHERGVAGGVAGRGAIDIKFGAGGMLDVYFAARYLQLRDDVRDAGADRSTRTTLARLRDAGSLDAETHRTLSEGYDTLRALDHHLRLIAGRSSRLPAAPDHAVLRDLARSVGHDSAAALTDTLRARMSAIRAAYDRITTRVD
ncbi:MAG: [glutamine synthetase] adenylyltransferase / [glutamine synthetase]-adenylyl-L-tyrosine, partial [Acidobacteriota bacterium]|nr:[glutamine synthetase] adenylyltransferase / [glutamine synthetase]-adenylyl-L-tyrosine [Acidobacteriota bacterium]